MGKGFLKSAIGFLPRHIQVDLWGGGCVGVGLHARRSTLSGNKDILMRQFGYDRHLAGMFAESTRPPGPGAPPGTVSPLGRTKVVTRVDQGLVVGHGRA